MKNFLFFILALSVAFAPASVAYFTEDGIDIDGENDRIIAEGSTDDANETTVDFKDPSADRTFTVRDFDSEAIIVTTEANAPSGSNNVVALVTDASSSSDCDTSSGTGSVSNLCVADGAGNWQDI